jgi:hypothetical protein
MSSGAFAPNVFDPGVFDVQTLGRAFQIPVSAVTAIEIEVSVMAETKNIAIPRGSRATLNFANVGTDALPGTSIKVTVARAPNSTVKMIGPKDCTTPSDDAFTCVLSSQDTDVAPGKYFWDARCVDEGAETLLVSGICVITPVAGLPASA